MREDLVTVTEIADELNVAPAAVDYIIRKHRIKPDNRIGIIRLFNKKLIKAVDEELKTPHHKRTSWTY